MLAFKNKYSKYGPGIRNKQSEPHSVQCSQASQKKKRKMRWRRKTKDLLCNNCTRSSVRKMIAKRWWRLVETFGVHPGGLFGVQQLPESGGATCPGRTTPPGRSSWIRCVSAPCLSRREVRKYAWSLCSETHTVTRPSDMVTHEHASYHMQCIYCLVTVY